MACNNVQICSIHGALQSGYATMCNVQCNNSEDNLFVANAWLPGSEPLCHRFDVRAKLQTSVCLRIFGRDINRNKFVFFVESVTKGCRVCFVYLRRGFGGKSVKTSFTDVCFRHLSNLYRLQESHWKKYMDYRLIPVRVLSCVVRHFDYECDHVRQHLRLCPLMADETDAGLEAPAPESVRRIGGVFGSSLSCPMFFLAALR